MRMPRSHRTMLWLPSEMMYSAALSHSSMVAANPRFKSTGMPERPHSLRSSKFCMFLAPIWIISTYLAAVSRARWLVTSQTTARPVASLASFMYRRPSSSRP